MVLLAIPLGLYTLWQAIRYKNTYYLQERLGLFRTDIIKSHDIWIHAASVGEVNAVMPLIHRLKEECNNISILMTTTTPTGTQVARKKLPPEYSCHFLPLDWQYGMTRFLESIQPACVLIMETELWPNLFQACNNRNIPITIINGRLSDRTMNAWPWMKNIYATMLTSTQSILARSQTDRDRFASLGANASTLEVIGNIKFAPGPLVKGHAIQPGRPYILAASTRNGEEKILVRTWKKLDTENRLLVIVPRHPQRIQQILRDLEPLNMEIAIRSRKEPIKETTQIYIADTIGELTHFFRDAELVFVGGSLVPLGGQNILEPAEAGKAVVFGPHMENFADEAALLIKQGAALQALDEAHLHSILSVLLESPEKVEAMAESGKKIMLENIDILERYMAALQRLHPIIKDRCS